MPGDSLFNERKKLSGHRKTSLGSVTNQKTGGLLNTSGRIANVIGHSAPSANSLFLSGLSELLLFWQHVSNDAAASLSEEYTQNRDVLFKELAAMAVGHVCYDLATQGSLASRGSESRSVEDAQWSFSRSELMRILVLSFGQDLSRSQRGAIIDLLNTNSSIAVAGLVDWEQYLNLLKMVNDLRSHSCPHVPDSKCMSTVENVANLLTRMDDGKEKIVLGDAGKQIKVLEAVLLLRSAAAVSVIAFRKRGISGEARERCLSFLHRVLRREEMLYSTLVIPDTRKVLATLADSRALRDEAQELLSQIKGRRTSEERSPVPSSCETAHIDAVDATLPDDNSVDNNPSSLEENSNIELHYDNDEVVMGISEVLAQVRHLERCIGFVTNGASNLPQHKNASEKAKKHATAGKTTVGGRAVNSSPARWVGVRSHQKIVSSVHELLTTCSADNEQALLSLVRRLHSEIRHCNNLNTCELSRHNRFYADSVARRVRSLINDLVSVEGSRVSEQLNALLLYDMRGMLEYYAAGCVTYSVRHEAEVLFHELLFGIIVNIAVGRTAENHENMLVNPRMLASFTYLFGNLQHDVMIGAYAALSNAFRKRGQRLPQQLVCLLGTIFDLNCVVKGVDNTGSSCARLPGVTVRTMAQLIAEHYCVSKTKVGGGSAGTPSNSAVFSVGLLDVADVLLLESVAMWETFKSLVSWPYLSELAAKNCKSSVLDGRKLVLELRRSLRNGKAIDGSSVKKILGSIEESMKTVHGFLKRYSGIEANVDNAARFFNDKAYEFLNKDTGESSSASEEECLNLLRFLLCRSCESLKHAHDIVSSRAWEMPEHGEQPLNDAVDKYFSCAMIGPRSHKSEYCIYVGGGTCTETQTVGGGTARKNDQASTSLSTVEVSKIEAQVRCTAMNHA